jgi:hypothetical protein
LRGCLPVEVVDVDANDDRGVAIFEPGGAMAGEQQFRIAGDFPRRAADEPRRMLVNGRIERDFHAPMCLSPLLVRQSGEAVKLPGSPRLNPNL